MPHGLMMRLHGEFVEAGGTSLVDGSDGIHGLVEPTRRGGVIWLLWTQNLVAMGFLFVDLWE